MARRKRAPTIGLAIIARDEQDSLPVLLASIEGAFDQVALVDTGSTDGTVTTFREWAERTGQPITLGAFEWCDDFSAARNHAHGLLTTDWHSWADCDDEIIGAEHLRELAREMPGNVAGLMFDYVIPHADGSVNAFRRERLVRRGKGQWVDRIHERQAIAGRLATVPATVAHWRHARTDWTASESRNARIYARWREEDPGGLIGHLFARCDHLARRAGHFERKAHALEEALEAAADRLTELTGTHV